MAWHWIALCAAGGALALFLLAGFGVAVVGAFMITRCRHPKIRPDEERMREINVAMGHVDFDAYDSWEKEPFTLQSQGAQLRCWYIPAKPEFASLPPKCLVRVHGFGVNHITSVRYAAIFRELGYSCVIYDQRSFGESTGICSLGYFERQDLAAIVAWVRGRLGEGTLIGLHGESLGAITVLEGLDIVPDLAFAVSDSCSTTVYDTFTAVTHLPAFPFLSAVNLWARLRHGADLRTVRPIDRVANSGVPILFCHGTKDRPMPYQHSERLFAASKNPLSRLELFEGVWHTGGHMVETERYERAVREFVQAAEDAFEGARRRAVEKA